MLPVSTILVVMFSQSYFGPSEMILSHLSQDFRISCSLCLQHHSFSEFKINLKSGEASSCTWILGPSISNAHPTYFSYLLFKQTFITPLESDSFMLTVRLTAEDSESHVLLTSVRRSTV